ncbi:MAG TPA: ABC-F family ATP-binding cassette domain-containing protein [Planctomycetota bacterium]|nr:ABC-F family ATP-binding cassette domain-containing protein [Planctomycetota bacterium]
MPVILSCRGLAKWYDSHALFEDLTLGIDAGARVGLIGPNGSGKSTLMRILAGLEVPDEGDRAVAQGARLTYLPQSDQFPADATPETALTEAMVASHPGLEDYERDQLAAEALEQAGFGVAGNPGTTQAVSTLSGGWRKRLAIARALASEPDVLLMDEPTNHLDLEGIWWLERTLTKSKATIVVVSHDRFFLQRACNRVIELNKVYPGGCFGSTGGYVAFLEKRAEFLANQKSRQDSLDNQVRREIEWLRANPSAQTVKSKARVDRASAMMSDLSALSWRNSQTRRADIDFSGTGRRTNDLVVLEECSKRLGTRALFSDVSLTLSPGTRLGLLGLNGSGKTTFLNVLTKRLAPDTGKVRHATELKIEIFDQRRERLDPRQPLRKALCASGETVVYRGRGQHVAAWAKRFLFGAHQLDLEVGKLSGGEQARVLIANLMLKPCDLLVLDEPTNDLDIPSLEVLEQSLMDFPGAVALVTHDRYLLDRVSTQLLALDGAGGAYQVADCAQWEDLAERLLAQAPGSMPAALASPSTAKPKTASPGLSGKERRELDRMSEKIHEAEARVASLEARTGDPTVVADPAALEAACEQLATAQAEVDKLYARWQHLEAKAG